MIIMSQINELQKLFLYSMTLTMMSLCIITSLMANNPMKICWKLMIMMVLTSVNMWMKTSMTWGPIMMSLIFLGGILIMFMMISSLTPSKMSKMSNMKFMMVLLMMSIILLFMYSTNNMENQSLQMNEVIHNKEILAMTFTLILMYFITVNYMTLKEFSSLRYHL